MHVSRPSPREAYYDVFLPRGTQKTYQIDGVMHQGMRLPRAFRSPL
jgi:hypothetical protein